MKKNIIVFGVIAAATALLAGCMNPLDFNPDEFALNVNANITGELSVDQINSSEVQVRNHTKSIDVIEIKFVELAETDPDNAIGTLTAQISGAPTAGTQESIFLRPWKKYRIELKWREASPPDSAYNRTTEPTWDWGGSSVDGSKVISNLPRGKYVVHVYRGVDGNIKISIDDNWTELIGNDHHHDTDFVLNVKPETTVDLSGMTINLSLPSDPISVNVDFSDAVKNQLTMSFDKISQSIDDLRSFPKGYGFVIVKNKTSKAVDEILFTKPVYNYGLTTVSAGSAAAKDESVGVLMAQGTPQVTLTFADGSTLGPKNVNVVDNKIVYLHLYEVNGTIESEINDNPTYNYQLLVKMTSEYDKYGSLTVYNMTGKTIDNVYFLNPAQGTEYFSIQNISKQGAKGPALNNGDQNIYVLVGNYKVGVNIAGYTADIFDRKIESLLYNGPTKLYIYEGTDLPANAPPGESVLITKNTVVNYQVTADGGNGDPKEAPYSTTKLTFVFDTSYVGTPVFTYSGQGNAVIGTVTRVNGTTFEATCSYTAADENDIQRLVQVICTNTDVNSSAHPVNIYARDTTTPPAQPVITHKYIYKASGVDAVNAVGRDSTIQTVVVPYQRLTGHQFDWWLEYDDVTYTDGVETARTTVHKARPGSWLVDGSNSGGYVTFNTTGYLNIGPRPSSGFFVGNDVVGATTWLFLTGIEWDQTQDGHIIEEMPYSTVPLYILTFQIGSRKVYGLTVNVRVTN